MSTSRLRALVTLCMTALCPAAALHAAEDAPVTVTARVIVAEADETRVADSFRYEVQVSCPRGTRVEAPDVMPALGTEFALIRTLPVERRMEGGLLELTFGHELRALAEGEHEIGGLSVAYRAPGEREAREAPVPPVALSVRLEPVETLAPLIAQPLGPPYWLGWALVLGLVAAGALGVGVWLLRSRRRRPAREPPRTVVAAHERALRELDLLAEADLVKAGEAKQFYSRLSAILREYLEARFEVPAMEQTTWMIGRALQSPDVEKEWREEFTRLLGMCDLVKFAEQSRSEADARADLAGAREAVARSRHVPPVAPQTTEHSEAAVS